MKRIWKILDFLECHLFLTYHESTVGVLEGGMGGEDGVVGLDDSGGDLWGGVDGEFQL